MKGPSVPKIRKMSHEEMFPKTSRTIRDALAEAHKGSAPMAVDTKMSKHLRRHGPAVDHSLRKEGDVRAQVMAISDELREQASGSQDGYLLDVSDRLRNIVEETGS